MRWNGSTIGKRDEPDNLAGASGVWSLRDQDTYQRSNQWTSVVPTAIPNLSLWLDASDSSTLFDATSGGSTVAADGAVARWEDKSGGGRHFAQSTANNRPLRRTAQYNGKDVLDFDGVNDGFFGTASGGINSTEYRYFITQSEHSIFVVGIADTVGTNSANSYQNEAFYGDGNGHISLYLRSNGNVGVANYDSGGYDNVTTAYSAGSLALFGVELSGGSLRLRLNGQSESTTASGAFAPVGTSSLQVGQNYNAADYCLDGKIGEMLIYRRALNSANRQAIEGYLAHKWGLSSSLPATHPYKNVVP
jgi:hypothetical protein